MSAPTDLWTTFCHLPGSIPLAQAAELARQVGVEPTSARIEVGDDFLDLPASEDLWARIEGARGASSFEIEGPGESDVSWSGVLASEFSCSGVPLPEGARTALLETSGLILGVSGDFTDARWQGETNPDHYRMWFDGPWEHLPRTVDARGRERIDVSGNPGRITHVAGLPLWAAQDLWFGPDAALAIDYDAIPSLPVGSLDDLGSGRWHVRLWEDGAAPDDVRRAQQALRDHLGYDAAAERVDDIRDALLARSGA